jgi:hypothetical protein
LFPKGYAAYLSISTPFGYSSDAYAEKYNLQDQDWRLQKPWYKPDK